MAIEAGHLSLPLKVFVSYAHEDDPHREALASHLAEMVREGLIRLWHDRRLTGGREWAGAIADELKSADIVLLLISRDFLRSEYCNDTELAEALRLHDTGQARVVPVILRSCDWTHSRFARLTALPPDGLPVVEARHPDQRFTAVAEGLRAIVAEIHAARGAIRSAGDAAAGATAGVATHPPTDARPGTAPQHPPRPLLAPTGIQPGPRTLRIAKLSLLGIELGPFELPLPKPGAKTAVLLLTAMLAAAWAAYGGWLRDPMDEAARAMRIGDYQRAAAQTAEVPAWLAHWPAVANLRDKARLGISLNQPPQDWPAFGAELARLQRSHPQDADLHVLQAQLLLRRDGNQAQARAQVQAALAADPGHAEAWFLQGLDLDTRGELRGAEAAYAQASQLAPDTPHYRSNWGHAALEQGRFEDALVRYQGVNQFPLAWLEKAHALWAQGRWADAAEAQLEAQRQLADAALMGRFFNRREWTFFLLSDSGVRLPSTAEKRCYAVWAEVFSRALLAGPEVAAVTPPVDCPQAPAHIGQLLADDLCRYVDGPQPAHTGVAQRLRGRLLQPLACPPGPASGAKSGT